MAELVGSPVNLELPDVANTALVTLHCRAHESVSEQAILRDERAEKIVAVLKPHLSDSQLELHNSLARGEIEQAMQTYVALRSRHFDRLAAGFLECEPEGLVVNLGGGLDTRRWRLNSERVVDLDLPEMIALRRELLGEGSIAADVMDFSWMDEVAEACPKRVLILAEGLFMYLQPDQVRGLVRELARRFQGTELVAEVFNRFWLEAGRRAQIDAHLAGALRFGADAKFVSGLSDAHEMESWMEGIRFLGDWSFLDENEPKLGRLRKLRHFPRFRTRQWVVHYRLGN
jgi:methyltransferase (TIGR00027 family)